MDVQVDISESGEYVSVSPIDSLIFWSQRHHPHPKGSYATTLWKVDPRRIAEFYIKQLSKFYEALKHGAYEKRTCKEPRIVIVNEHGCKGFPLYIDGTKPNLEERAKSLLTSLNIINFNLLMFITDYANFGLSSSNQWFPENGKISVSAHQDISKPLSELISATASIYVPPNKIERPLKDIYTFN